MWLAFGVVGGVLLGGTSLGDSRETDTTALLDLEPPPTLTPLDPTPTTRTPRAAHMPRLPANTSTSATDEVAPSPPLTVAASAAPVRSEDAESTLEPPPTLEGAMGILLLGIDRRPDQPPDGTRTDTMLLLVVYPETQAATLISIPRDLWVPIPGYGEQRINVAHAVGGPELAKRTVERNFGVAVDHYARVDFDGFQQLVDELGGVPVDVGRPVIDNAYPTPDYGTTRIHIPSGPQLLDGETALQFVRSRHSDSDFGRMERQQQFLLALRQRALQLDVLPKLPGLIGLLRASVSTDLGAREIIGLAHLASAISPQRLNMLVLDTRYVQPYRSPAGADLLLPKRSAIRAAIGEAIAASEQPEQSPITAGPSEGELQASSAAGPSAPRVTVSDS